MMPYSAYSPRQMLDALPWIIIALDAKGELNYLNPDALSRTRLGSPDLPRLAWPNYLFAPKGAVQWNPIIDRALSGETVFAQVLPTMSPAGTEFNCTWAAIPLRNASSAITGVLCVGQAGSSAVGEQPKIPIGDGATSLLLNAVVLTDLTGIIVYASSSFLKMWGYERGEEVVGRSYSEFCEGPNQLSTLRESLHRDGSLTANMIGRRRDGSRLEIQVAASLIRDAAGAPTHLIACANDVSDQRKAEAALRESEQRLSLIFKSTPDPQVLFRVESECELVFEAVNQSYFDGVMEQFPHFSGEMVGRRWIEVITELGFSELMIEQIAAKQQQVLALKQSVRYEYEVPGKVRECFLEVQLKPVLDTEGRCTHIFWNAHDLTSKRKSEKILRESESRLSLIFNASSDFQALYRVESGGRLVLEAANNSFKNGFGSLIPEEVHKLEGLCRTSVMTAIGADKRYLELETIACRDASQSGAVRMIDLPLSTPNGKMHLEVRIEPVSRDAAGCSHILWTGRDVSYRRRAEQEIRRSEEMYRLLFEQMPDGVFVIETGEQSPIKFSESWAASLGYSKEEFSALSMRQVCAEEDYPAFASILLEMQTDRKRRVHDLRFIAQSGAVRRFELSIAPIEREDRLLFQCIARDITEYCESQSQVGVLRDALAHVARVGTMGEMATGLAHELNQPLGALQLYATAAKDMSAPLGHSKLSEVLQKLCEQSLRAGQIIRRMRSFVGRTPSICHYCDLNQLVREVLKLLESDLRQQSVVLDLKLDPSLSRLSVDGIQIQQVLVNLIRNALESMMKSKTRRRLSITTRTTDTFQELSVSDTGAGIEDQVLERLFQPFTSSKADGLGLGLAISKTLIEAHGGHIYASNDAPGGATFRFTLPISSR